MDHKAYDLDGDYYLSAEYSHNGADPWYGTSYVVRNWSWCATRWVPKDEPRDVIQEGPDAVPQDN